MCLTENVLPPPDLDLETQSSMANPGVDKVQPSVMDMGVMNDVDMQWPA